MQNHRFCYSLKLPPKNSHSFEDFKFKDSYTHTLCKYTLLFMTRWCVDMCTCRAANATCTSYSHQSSTTRHQRTLLMLNQTQQVKRRWWKTQLHLMWTINKRCPIKSLRYVTACYVIRKVIIVFFCTVKPLLTITPLMWARLCYRWLLQVSVIQGSYCILFMLHLWHV